MPMRPFALLAALVAGTGCHKQPAGAESRSRRGSSGLPGGGQIKTVFLILMENENWQDIVGNPAAPYLNEKLLPQAAYATQYYNPPGIHPSLPNYLWLEAGDWFGVGLDDSDPSRGADELATTAHLATLLTASGRSWKEYAEAIDGHGCPLVSNGPYAAKHNPFVYFDDITGHLDPRDPTCLAHNRPYTELASDLGGGAVASYNFITPNQCNDMHSCPIAAGDRWLSTQLPILMASHAYQDGRGHRDHLGRGREHRRRPDRPHRRLALRQGRRLPQRAPLRSQLDGEDGRGDLRPEAVARACGRPRRQRSRGSLPVARCGSPAA